MTNLGRRKLSVIIPARNEGYLLQTINSVLDAAQGSIEVIVILDGYWPEPPIPDSSSVTIIHHTLPVGQRRAINEAAKIATGQYIMKLDAHCAVGIGFDNILKEDCKYEWTMVPRMHNLDIKSFMPKYLDDVETGLRRAKIHEYMYISGPNHKDKNKPYGLRAMYYGKFAGASTKRPSSDKLIDETMCCMGPGWFMHKDRFWELGGCDEGHGGWGQQGVEVSLKAWLSGGALMVNKKTWFAHWFRGGGGPGFPYKISAKRVEDARAYSRDLWLNDKWEGQKRPLSWLVEKFKPPTWDIKPGPKVSTQNGKDLSVIIPSFRDPLLHKTIQSVLDNFETDYEIIPVVDGYRLKQPIVKHERVKPIYLEKNVGMREAINTGVRAARGQFLMRSDEHCMFGKGFDKIVLSDIKDDEIVDTRRYFLDPVNWKLMDRSPIDYEKLIVKQMSFGAQKFASVEWPTRTKKRADVMIDENMCLQGSVWVMARSWWDKVIGQLQTDGYGPLYQDTIEMLFKTWKAGGRLTLNKNTWYAHRHRKFGRTHRYTHGKAVYDWHYSLLKHYDEYLEVKERWGV